MSRTYLVQGQAHVVDPVHAHSALNTALVEAGVIESRFQFDLLEAVCDLITTPLLDDVLSSLVWYTEVLIKATVQAMLSNFYAVTKKGAEVDDNPFSFENYDACVKYIESLEPQADSLEAFGLESKSAVHTIHALMAFRDEVYNAISHNADLVRSRAPCMTKGYFDIPSADLLFDTPATLRRVSARDEKGFLEIAEDEIKRAGLTVVEEQDQLRAALLEQQRYDQEVDNLSAYGWDKMKAAALRQIWVCVSMTDMEVSDDPHRFLDLDAAIQYKLMARVEAATSKARAFLLKGNKLKLAEKAAMRVEVIELLKQIDAAVKHPRFADL